MEREIFFEFFKLDVDVALEMGAAGLWSADTALLEMEKNTNHYWIAFLKGFELGIENIDSRCFKQ